MFKLVHLHKFKLLYIYKGMTLQKNSLKFHYFLIFPQKERPTCENLPLKIKQKILLTKRGGGGGVIIKLFNSKISLNYVSFISKNVKCIATLLEKMK